METENGANSGLPQGAVEKAILLIRDLIREENLRIGARLPAERELAKQFRVGRPAVREAVRALGIMGVLSTRRGSGTYVASLLGDLSDWPSRILLDETNFPLLQLLEVRQMIEPKAAALAASRATDNQLARMESHLRAQGSPASLETFAQEDVLFHEAVLEAAGNLVLRNLFSTLRPMLVMSRKLTARTTPDLPKILQQHRTIFEAIRLGQPALAEEAMSQHLRTTGLDIIARPRDERRLPVNKENKHETFV
jgi:GntR family transcriptional regulator, transcriptional repressor for pyruvate dehydrogenase complex